MIDISRFDYCEGKESRIIDGLTIYIYSPTMIVCEKLRALCQQMPEYAEIVKRGRSGSARARDFVDIHQLMNQFAIDLSSDASWSTLGNIFHAKRVPLRLLGELENYREFHRQNFQAVQDTVKPGIKLKDFDFCFDYVGGLIKKLKPFGDK